MSDVAFQKCINPACGATFDCGQAIFKCPACGDLLDARYDWDRAAVPSKLSDFATRVLGHHEFTGTLTLGGLDIGPSYVLTGTEDDGFQATRVCGPAAVGDAFATYHRPPGGDLNAGHSYISMLDGHVRKVTVVDQLRASQPVEGLPESPLGRGGNLHLAWPLDVPPLAGWENQ